MSAAVAALTLGSPAGAGAPEAAFVDANKVAMAKMMAAMNATPSGDVDVDFVNMMEPHHRGAVEMAVLELRYGTNPQLRRIAQEIIVGQTQEIDAMRMAIGRPLSAAVPVPTQQGRVR
ncbi:DUF305 domain-containing protein [Sphingosinicellaceae bacterium]|nr:DUF305 domain-containing protein [Sphingosinicellaceae bacterium]